MRSPWTDARLAYAYASLDAVSETLTSGSTECGLVREAMSKLALADEYVEMRKRDESDDRGCAFCGRETGESHREDCSVREDEGEYVTVEAEKDLGREDMRDDK